MYSLVKHLWLTAWILSGCLTAEPTSPVNKLLYMYHFFYLPFSIGLGEGKTRDEIYPLIKTGEGERLLIPNEIKTLEGEWSELREIWKKKSLLLNTPVSLHQSVQISQHIKSHSIPLSRTAFDRMSINDRIILNEMLKSRTPEIQAEFRQIRFLKSFLTTTDEERVNFFIVSASWCDSCKQYRVLLETYLKSYPKPDLNLHSVVIEDPKEQIFKSPILKELFPHPDQYSHDTIPKFLALDMRNGEEMVYEEGEALKVVYEGFFEAHKGAMDSELTLFRKNPVPQFLNISAIAR